MHHADCSIQFDRVMNDMILLVEDSGNDADLIRRAFEEAGVTNPMFVVRDGEAVIAYLKGAGAFADRGRFPIPAVLLLDLNLPRVGGFEVLEWLRRTPELRQILVVVLSGHSGLKEVARAYSLGANSFLVKPCNPAEIQNLIAAFPEYWISPPSVSSLLSPTTSPGATSQPYEKRN